MENPNATVYIIDDDESVLKAVARLVSSMGFTAKTYSNPLAFLDCRQYESPGCILLDLRMPEITGLELQDRLKQEKCHLPIIFVSGHGDIPISVKAIKLGAIDFLQKPFDDEDLMSAIQVALKKDVKAMANRNETAAVVERVKSLTPREYEVFRWVITGILNKQIARKLGTVEKTVKVHRGRVMAKMKADSVAHLVRLSQLADVSPHDENETISD